MGGVDDGAVREAQALEDAQGEQGQAAQATVTDADAAVTYNFLRTLTAE